MLNIILAAITKNGIKMKMVPGPNENGARPHFFMSPLLTFFEKMLSFYKIFVSITKNCLKRWEKWQDLCRNKIIFLTEFTNYVVLKINSFLYLSYITHRKLCSII